MVKMIDGGIYECENGDIVKVRRNNLPYYRFSAVYIQYAGETLQRESNEKWTDDGVSYHDDCGYNIVKQIS